MYLDRLVSMASRRICKTIHTLVIDFIVVLILASQIANSVIEGELLSTNIYGYPYSTRYYGYGVEMYTLFDYDQDVFKELFILLYKDVGLVNGVLLVINTTDIEYYRLFIEYKPLEVTVVDKTIIIIGYNLSINTFEALVINDNLEVTDKLCFPRKYPIPITILSLKNLLYTIILYT